MNMGEKSASPPKVIWEYKVSDKSNQCSVDVAGDTTLHHRDTCNVMNTSSQGPAQLHGPKTHQWRQMSRTQHCDKTLCTRTSALRLPPRSPRPGGGVGSSLKTRHITRFLETALHREAVTLTQHTG